MELIKQYLTRNDCYNSGGRITPIGIQVHSIGTAQNTATALLSYWNQSVGVCVHYVCDAETAGVAYQLMPENYRSWADGGFGNGNLITIEMMESDYMEYTGGANYKVLDEGRFKADIMRSYNTCVELCASICKQHGWNPTDSLGNGLLKISSHNEGRVLGLSSAHVDPTHIWPRFGLDMDKFRDDVKKAMDGQSATPSVPVEYFRVGTDWKNGKCINQQGAYTIKENSIRSCPTGYKVFDESGKVVYSAPTIPSGKDHIWLGWTSYESGKDGFRCVNGDRGKAYGKYQFDYRYSLVDFMKFCIDKDSKKYAQFKLFISYGTGDVRLVNNTSLANVWINLCNNYAKEFEALQDTFAYNTYYTEVKKYIQNLYGINLGNHSPVVKGSAYSMSIRSGALSAAKKFDGCSEKTDDMKMLEAAYKTYGNEDADRWPKQLQDAKDAYSKNIYSVIDLTPESAPDEPTMPILKYAVGTYVNCSSYYLKDNDGIDKAMIKNYSGTITETKPGTMNPYHIDDKYWCNDGDIRSTGKPFSPYSVKITAADLRIRVSPGGTSTGEYTGKGTFTIIKESKDSNGNLWGLLKSGEKKQDRWIALYLDCVKRV